jgi:ribosomal protein L18E
MLIVRHIIEISNIRRYSMENELIYAIGEVLMMELDEIEKVTYPQSYEPDSLKIETKSGKCYQLVLSAIE